MSERESDDDGRKEGPCKFMAANVIIALFDLWSYNEPITA